RDEVDRDVDREPLVVAVEQEPEQDDDCSGEAGGREFHTRLTCLRPKSPVGFTSRTSRSTRKEIGNPSSRVAMSTYWPIRLRTPPRASSPTTAPAGLSSPPSTAAAK